jgi:hypothetical protein
VLGVILGLAVAAALGGFVYLGRERLGPEGLGLAALRTVGLGALVLLLFNPVQTGRTTGGPPTVLLDASLSMGAAGGPWQEALDSARSLAGARGPLLRFGSDVAPFDTLPPADGLSRVRAPLMQARADGAPTIVVTDGELTDAQSLPPSLLSGVRWVVLPRDSLPGAALLQVDVPEVVQRGDSIPVTVTLAVWGGLDASSGTLEITAGERRLLARDFALPPSGGRGERRFALAPGTMAAGEHVLRLRLGVPGDVESRDNERLRAVTVTDQPAAVVIVDPPDWEGRFLVHALGEVAGAAVWGYARATDSTWIDMRTLRRVPQQRVRAAARRAGLLVVRSGRPGVVPQGRTGPVWRWPAGSDALVELFVGDWYVPANLPASPVAGRLAGLAWDSLPPLSGVVPFAPTDDEWVGLSARQGRRGAARPVLVGRDSAGQRQLTTAGTGLWRWALRGGRPGEAYRALVAAGVDWLLRSGTTPGTMRLTALRVVPRGVPAAFRWRGDSVPDSVAVALAGGDTTRRITLQFDPDGVALVSLEPGVYRWSAPLWRAGGVVAVESYSDEFAPRPVVVPADDGRGGARILEVYARQRWWLFVVAVLALAGEWAWRQRRGLP